MPDSEYQKSPVQITEYSNLYGADQKQGMA